MIKNDSTKSLKDRYMPSSSSSRPSSTTIDELMKRLVFVYLPVFTLFCLFSSTFIIPSISDSSNADDVIIKYVVLDSSKAKSIEPFQEKNHQGARNTYVVDNNRGSNLSEEVVSGGIPLDFLVAGFPKSGSTSLLHLFAQHQETSVAPIEVCAFHTDMSITKLSSILSEFPLKSPSMKRGIKCPTSVWDAKGLVKLSALKRDLKLIIGVRHPVFWFQSYYNYRVTEMHDKNVVMTPPPPEKLIGSKSWRGVSTDAARFDLGLMQLGKIEVEPSDLVLLGKAGRRIFPSKFKVFLYSIEQLEDDNEDRSKSFRRDLQTFLGLDNDIESIPKSNVNHFVGESKHPETINICDEKYSKLRSILIKNGSKSNRWLRSEFAHHMDVTVGGRNHFLRIIDSWEADPCLRVQTDTTTVAEPTEVKNETNEGTTNK